jgi:hypothetical protein
MVILNLGIWTFYISKKFVQNLTFFVFLKLSPLRVIASMLK